MVDEFLRENLPCSGSCGSGEVQGRRFSVGYLKFLGWLVQRLRWWGSFGSRFAKDRATPATESMTCGTRVNMSTGVFCSRSNLRNLPIPSSCQSFGWG